MLQIFVLLVYLDRLINAHVFHSNAHTGQGQRVAIAVKGAVAL